jgi:hypothetical protein
MNPCQKGNHSMKKSIAPLITGLAFAYFYLAPQVVSAQSRLPGSGSSPGSQNSNILALN